MNLQQLTDQMVEGLSRPVVIVDPDDRPLAMSGRARPDDPTHLSIPIRDRRGAIGSFRLMTDGRPPLTPADYALIDAASSVARDLLGDSWTTDPATDRAATMSRLLDDDSHLRRMAFAEAVARRWLDRGARTVVRAVLVDERVGVIRKVAFGRHLAASGTSSTTFVREQESFLYLVTREAAAEVESNAGAAAAFDAWVGAEAARLGVPVLSIGSARHDAADDDLVLSAQQARIAAELTASLPELQPSRGIDELGGWVLLHAVAPGSRRLSDISPAAEVLCRNGDSLQRQTVETYLDAGGQARAACERLHIHRTTLYYRLENMPEIVREALDDGMKRSTLHLALKLIRLWEATGVR